MTVYLVWSNQHRMWWRADLCGYTDSIEEAGRYQRHEAERIVASATVDGRLLFDRTDPVTGQQYKQPSEVMILAPECPTEPGGEDR